MSIIKGLWDSQKTYFLGLTSLVLFLLSMVFVLRTPASAGNMNVVPSNSSRHVSRLSASDEVDISSVSPDLRLLISILQAWESRFDKVDVTYYAEGQNIDEASELVLWPGYVRLVAKQNEVDMQSVEYGRVWRVSFDDTKELPCYTQYGTEFAADVVSHQAAVTVILQRLGVDLVGGMRMSEALLHASDAEVSRDNTNKLLICTFDPPEASGLHERVSIEVSTQTGLLHSVEIGGGGARLRSTVETPSSWSSSSWFPFKILVDYKEAEGDYKSKGGYVIQSVVPLRESPVEFQPAQGVGVRDGATGYDIKAEEVEIEAFSAEKASIVMGLVRDGDYNSNQKSSDTTPLCGPASLYYLARLNDLHCSTNEVINEFPNVKAGVSLAEIDAVCGSFGWRGKAARFDDMDLDKVPLPAILSVQPSHFIVLFGRAAGKYQVIDSPYQVIEMDSKLLQSMWSGYAYWLEGSK